MLSDTSPDSYSLYEKNKNSATINDDLESVLKSILKEIVETINYESQTSNIHDNDENKVSILELEQFADKQVLNYINKYEKKQEKELKVILNYLKIKFGDQDGPILNILDDTDENDISFHIVFRKCKNNNWDIITQEFWDICEQINFNDYRFGIICANCL